MSVSAVDAIQSERHYLTNVVLRTTKLNQDGWCVKIFVHRVTYSIRDFLIKNLCIIYTSFELFEIYFFFLFYIFGISISISILISQFKRARPFTKWKFLSTNNNCSDKWPRDCHLTYRHEIEWSFFFRAWILPPFVCIFVNDDFNLVKRIYMNFNVISNLGLTIRICFGCLNADCSSFLTAFVLNSFIQTKIVLFG